MGFQTFELTNYMKNARPQTTLRITDHGKFHYPPAFSDLAIFLNRGRMALLSDVHMYEYDSKAT